MQIRLKEGREKAVSQNHPWIFSGAIAEWRGPHQTGITDVVTHDGTWLARGFAHPEANLTVRVYSWDEKISVDEALFARRIDEAVTMREKMIDTSKTNAYRLIFSEADGLSGLIVDRYADLLSIHFSAQGLVPFSKFIVDALRKRTGIDRVYVAVERDAIEREHLDVRALTSLSTESAPRVSILENGFTFTLDFSAAQKTGFYLDQRMNRLRVASYAKGRNVLSAYCYTGAFEVYAAAQGAASIIGIDSSDPALLLAKKHHELNNSKTPIEYLDADVPQKLRTFRDSAKKFDMIILDPPRFVTNFSQKEKGMRGYKDINLLALKLLTPGGVLATFSCSGLISANDLKMVLAWATKDSGRRVRIVESLGQPADHPVLTSFPESEYLCGFICYVD